MDHSRTPLTPPTEAAASTSVPMLTYRGCVTVDLPGGCDGWNDNHDCGREPDHAGDHVCLGCHDQWNRGDWDHATGWEREVEELERAAEYPEESRCAFAGRQG